uniref:Uncharacterized protein n=1 Tax=viral metagenome TaxID=1070528 RepID=A0A6C0KCA2_9ZZZZ
MAGNKEEPQIVEPNPTKRFLWFLIMATAVVLAYYRNGKVLNLYMIPATLFSQIYIFVVVVYFFGKEDGFGQIKQYTVKNSN